MKQSVSLFEEFKGLRFEWPILEFSGCISIFSIKREQKGSEQHIITYINHFHLHILTMDKKLNMLPTYVIKQAEKFKLSQEFSHIYPKHKNDL